MKKYNELGHVYRNDPCLEYPGEYLTYIQGAESSHSSFHDAMTMALGGVSGYDTLSQDEPLKVSVCWKCSDDDPRVGEVWFTSFYQIGHFNQFCIWKTT